MTLSDFLAAAEKGAASVYHAVLATGISIINLETTHPAVAALIAEGVVYANDLLVRVGIPAAIATVVEADVLTALKAMAALDSTVPSIATTTTTTATTTAVPAT